jgi:hypothetical protein
VAVRNVSEAGAISDEADRAVQRIVGNFVFHQTRDMSVFVPCLWLMSAPRALIGEDGSGGGIFARRVQTAAAAGGT